MKTLLTAIALILSGAAVPAAQDPASYLVVLADGATAPQLPGRIERTFTHALRGYEITMTPAQSRRLARHPAIASVQRDETVTFDLGSQGALGTQPNPPSWGLDRIDQRNLPLDKSFTYPNTAFNVHAYIMSTGVRTTHEDFEGRATHGWDTVDNDGDATDCNGHGTYVAGLVGGAEHGVAKEVNLVAMRVLNCAGSATYSQIIAGVEWVTANAIRPAVAVLPIGGGPSDALDSAVRNSIASGISYVLVAGSDSCYFSPGRVPEGITVDGTTINDAVMTSSGTGACIDLFAPGVNITSTWHTTDTATITISGGSAAAALTAGAAALIHSAHPTWTAAQVHAKIVADATPDVLTGVPPESPNLLLYVDNGSCGGTNQTDIPIPDFPGPAVYSSITVTGCPDAPIAALVEVHIVHTYIGDLSVHLITPDGSVYRLHNQTGGSADNLDHTYSLNLSPGSANGTWRLRVRDHARRDTGYIDSWTLSL